MSISSLLSAFTLILLSSSLTAQKSTELFPAKASGWKQAGPGSFSIKDGIATSEGGMGMWWYAGKSYQNATFDIEFQLPDHKWNSGIFVRFPNPGKDPWVAIRQGYECQVSGDKPGKLSTGAIYDIQTASHITLKKPGEWNHYQITTIGNLIIIAINGELVNVYTAQQGRGEKEGYIGLQNHDPISKVNYRKVSVREWSADATLNGVLAKLNITRADWVRYHAKKSKSSHWTDKADLGPAWANTFGDYYQGKHRVSALKGLSLQLSQAHQIRGLYNTETMQLHSAHRGGLEWGGTPWTGRHGTYVTMANSKTTIMQTRANRPAWADSDGSFADTRSHKGHGNFPENHLRFNGHFRNGSQVILDYSVLGSRVLETLTATSRGDQAMAFRQFDLAPSAQKRTMIVADEQGAHVSMSKDGKSAVISKQPVKQESETPVAQPGKITIVKDCTRKAWSDLSMGAPSNKDLVDRSKNKTDYFRVLPKFLPTHARGGDEE
ncbi:MAG: family 16 glycoside hydrolase, partial [Akkermansiaceae bacterium]